MDMRRLVGKNVRRIRLAKGLTQEELSVHAGFTQQYLSDLERGLRNPTIVTLYELALALGVDHVELVTHADGRTSRGSLGSARKAKQSRARE